jgi:hypothetical protein
MNKTYKTEYVSIIDLHDLWYNESALTMFRKTFHSRTNSQNGRGDVLTFPAKGLLSRKEIRTQ